MAVSQPVPELQMNLFLATAHHAAGAAPIAHTIEHSADPLLLCAAIALAFVAFVVVNGVVISERRAS